MNGSRAPGVAWTGAVVAVAGGLVGFGLGFLAAGRGAPRPALSVEGAVPVARAAGPNARDSAEEGDGGEAESFEAAGTNLTPPEATSAPLGPRVALPGAYRSGGPEEPAPEEPAPEELAMVTSLDEVRQVLGEVSRRLSRIESVLQDEVVVHPPPDPERLRAASKVRNWPRLEALFQLSLDDGIRAADEVRFRTYDEVLQEFGAPTSIDVEGGKWTYERESDRLPSEVHFYFQGGVVNDLYLSRL